MIRQLPKAWWMQHRERSAIIGFWVLLGASFLAVASDQSQGLSAAAPPMRESEAPPPRVHSDFFTENAGQVANPEVLYYARGGGVSVGFGAGAVLVNLRERPPHDDLNPRSGPVPTALAPSVLPATPLSGHLVRIAFEGADPVLPQGRGELPHRANFFLGDDPARWRTNVRNYAEVVYANAWEGIDVVYQTSPGGVKYDLIVHPGADLADVAFTYEGITNLAVTPRGITAETSLGPLRDDLPAAWQASGRPVDCALQLAAERTVGYACSGWDGTGDLVIDPLVYSTFLGGSGHDLGYAIALEASGAAYVTGYTVDAATDFPTTAGAFDMTHSGGTYDAFVAKLDASGSSLLYATFLGGSGWDWGYGISVDASGAAYVTGRTDDDVTDFPATPGAYDTTPNGFTDAFVAKLDASGSSLVYATFLGGSGDDEGIGIALDASGAAYVTGYTEDAATDFPTTPGAYDTMHNGGDDAFVVKFDATGSTLLYSTFLGGSRTDGADAIAVDASGAAYVTGYTRYTFTGFPTTPGAHDTTPNGGYDAYIAKLDPTGSTLLYSTFLGGSGDDEGIGIALDASGAAYVTGYVGRCFCIDWDFRTTPSAYDRTYNGGDDAFVVKFDPTGSTLLYSTFLGGSGDDEGIGIALDASGAAYVTGYTEDAATDFPTTPGAYDTTHNGILDVFVAKLDATGMSLPYSTFLGGSGSDVAYRIALDASGAAYVTGYTEDAATDFPTTSGAYDTTHNGLDVFVARLESVPGSRPVLSATGESYYVVDGLHPETGIAAATPFVYRVNYTDADGNPPKAGDPRVRVQKGGVSIPGSPFSMTEVDSLDVDVTDGKWYAYTSLIAPHGTDYTYSFAATDITRLVAADWPVPPADAPDVLNGPPTADAGPDQLGVFHNMLVTLHGTESSDPDGDVLTFSWAQTVGPAVTLTNPNTANPTFTPAAVGTYAFALTVDDGMGGNDTDTAIADVGNRVPTVDAGLDLTRPHGTLVTLDGVLSSDPDGDVPTYSWTPTSGAGWTLSGANTAGPSFTPAAPGTYPFTLSVDDGFGGSATDDMVVTAANTVPTADAGPDQIGVFRNALVTLDGAGSGDQNGDPLAYAWIQTVGPVVALAGAGGAAPSFTPTAAGTYSFRLTVDDVYGGTASDVVNVVVVNRGPTADAGPDQLGAFHNTLVTLDGTGSSDPEGDPLTYSWTQTAGPAVTLTNPNTANPTFTPAVIGTYAFALTVDDGMGGNAADAVTVGVGNRPPVADAGPNQPSAPKYTLLTLDATASADPDGDALSYTWTPPLGISLSAVNIPRPTFTATRSGAYMFSLFVSDPFGGTSADTVVVTVLNSIPVANAGLDQTVQKRTLVTLNGASSTDADGDLLSFTWSAPAGITLSDMKDRWPTFTPTHGGVYPFSLTVDDGDSGVSTDVVVVTVLNNLPRANAGVDQSVPKRALVILDGTASTDSDPGDVLSFTWTSPAGITLSSVNAASPSFIASMRGTYTFTLLVEDGDTGTDTDTVVVTVSNTVPVAIAGPDRFMQKLAMVTLDGSFSWDPDGDPLAYAWTAPPGITLSDVNAGSSTFTATTIGSFTFTLTVDDGDSVNNTATDNVRVTVWGLPPVADLTADRLRANIGGGFLFSGGNSTDPDGTVATYHFEFSDGTSQTGASPIAFHAYAEPGYYVVDLTVWDDDGGVGAVDTLWVTVNAPPVAAGTVTPASGPLTLSFVFASTSTDPDGSIVTTSWDFGDTTTGSGATATHTYASRQIFIATLTVSDNDGATDSFTLTVTVVNRAPAANAGVDRTVRVGDLVTLNATASTDPDGDALAYSWSVDPAGVTLSSTTASTPTYTPTAAGTWNFTLLVDDGTGGNDTATVTITVEAPPIQPPTPADNTILYVAASIALLVFLGLLALFALWKRRKPAEEETNEPEEPGGTKR